jgi:hypothetical protein
MALNRNKAAKGEIWVAQGYRIDGDAAAEV